MSVTDFYLNSSKSVVQLDTLEIRHPSFSKVYYIVRNSTINGLTATLETGQVVHFDYYPLSVSRASSKDNLDQNIKIGFGDLGRIMPTEIDNCRKAGTLLIKPTIVHRTYRSDDLSAPLDGPFIYQLPSTSQKRAQATMQAEAPKLNNNSTGELYTINNYPSLTGLL